MTLDLSAIPVIDNHIHIFALKKQGCAFDNCFAITSFAQDSRHLRNTMVYRLLMNELRRFLELPGVPDDRVLAERDRLLAENPRGYIQSLLADAGLRCLVCDLDAPISAYWTGNYRTTQEAKDFLAAVRPEVGVGCVVRIENVCNRLLKDNLPFEDVLAAFARQLEEKAKRYGAVAIKSVIGYYTGLAVGKVTAAEAQGAYGRFLADRGDAAAEKTWRDFMLWQGRLVCLDLGLPLHIHTGWGDTPYCDLRRMNPVLLYDFLLDEAGRQVPTVLLHAGFPYSREIAILASHLPQVYVDLSEMLPYAGRAAESILPQLMDIAPFTKIIYGSDGGGIAEPVWFGAVYARRVLARTLENCIAEGHFDEEYALQVARWILCENTLAVHPKLEGIPLGLAPAGDRGRQDDASGRPRANRRDKSCYPGSSAH